MYAACLATGIPSRTALALAGTPNHSALGAEHESSSASELDSLSIPRSAFEFQLDSESGSPALSVSGASGFVTPFCALSRASGSGNPTVL